MGACKRNVGAAILCFYHDVYGQLCRHLFKCSGLFKRIESRDQPYKKKVIVFYSDLYRIRVCFNDGAMLASATGITNPVKAFSAVVDNPYITFFVSAFIVIGTVSVNMVANIIPPTYVITLLTKLKFKYAVTITGLLAFASFPWVLVRDSSAKGLDIFILAYSAFLYPIVAILLIEYYIFRKQKVNIADLYAEDGLIPAITLRLSFH